MGLDTRIVVQELDTAVTNLVDAADKMPAETWMLLRPTVAALGELAEKARKERLREQYAGSTS